MDEKFADAYTLITEKLALWWESGVKMLPNFLLALVVLLIFVLIAKLVRKGARNILKKVVSNRALQKLVSTIIYVAVIFIGMFISLELLDLSKAVTSILAGAGIIGLALGFAFQDIASNFMSGIFMAVKSPFKVGDLIETNDIKGRVKRISLRATEMESLQGQFVVIPNQDVFQNPIINYSEPKRYRVDLECGVSYGDNLKKVKKVALEALEDTPNRLEGEDITFFYKEFGGSSINFQIRVWVEYLSHSDYLEARSEAIMSLKQAFDEADISIPFPIRTLDFGIRGGATMQEMIEDPIKGLKDQNSNN